ncbi:hypothetical protein FQN60_003898 [Etheostoma spectabile]|uniref:Uncharacterized protein n=1 Tax=Etheostoma spectabile TaxID=54343 RepID=A0A5J5CVN9_9PERO|nr:hypothetical protein FQN60_003898 [Etheostoma spectabile]
MHLNVWILLILKTIEHFKEVLNNSSTQMTQELQYFIIINHCRLEMFFLVLVAIYHVFDSIYYEILSLAKINTNLLPQTNCLSCC